MPKNRLFSVLIIIMLVLSACNLPVDTSGVRDEARLQTAAAATVAAELTAAALLGAPPLPSPTTAAPVPSNTSPAATAPAPAAASATSNCDVAQFVADVTVPDGTDMDPSEAFVKTWRLRNAGTCTWTTSYAVVYGSGNQMSGPATQALTGNVNPGQTVDISINLVAPASAGGYTGYWKLRNGSGVLFAEFYVQIDVIGGGGSDDDDADFAVTSVTFDVNTFDEGSYNDCPIVTAHITTNGAGDVKYRFTRSDGANSPLETLHFNSAGTKNVTEKWYLGNVHAGPPAEWIGIYIDDPNHQDFGHINVPACGP